MRENNCLADSQGLISSSGNRRKGVLVDLSKSGQDFLQSPLLRRHAGSQPATGEVSPVGICPVALQQGPLQCSRRLSKVDFQAVNIIGVSAIWQATPYDHYLVIYSQSPVANFAKSTKCLQ